MTDCATAVRVVPFTEGVARISINRETNGNIEDPRVWPMTHASGIDNDSSQILGRG